MRLLTLSLLMFAYVAHASNETDYRNNVQWAKDSVKNTQNNSGFHGFDVNTLCKDDTCKQQVANPDEKRYYNNADALTGDAAREAVSNEQSQAVTTSFNKGRPTIDPNDPAYATAVGYQNDAYNISHGISSKYHDCEKGLVCEVDSLPRSCTLPTNNPVQCYLTPFVKNTSTQNKEHTFLLSGLPPFHITLPDSGAKITGIRSQGQFLTYGIVNVGNGVIPIRVGPATEFHFSVDGSPIGTVPLEAEDKSCKGKKCPYTLNTTLSYQTGKSSFSLGIETVLKNGKKPVNIEIYNLSITILTLEQQAEIGYNNSCGAVLPECQQVQSQCIEGKETRMINGISVTLDCWKEQTTYQCAFPNTCSALTDCSIQSTSCDTLLGGVCIKNKQQRLCEKQQCRDTGLICGEDSFALSGNYYEPDTQKSTDFNSAATGLAAMRAAAEDVKNAANVTEHSPIIFKGTPMSCTNKPIGISNCCQDGGWGTDIGITSCSQEEKTLGEAKDKKLTVSLGEYCAESVLGACIRKKKSYCTFDSMLARIVQEDGRPQLGLNFGSAKHPNCSAFSPNQLQQINMENMDFSDFYEDMHKGTNLPDQNVIIDRLEQSVGGIK